MLLRMSLSGGILILMIAAVRLLAVNRLPKKYFMMLWGVALLRLLVPAELPFRFGVTMPVEQAVTDRMKLAAMSRDFLSETTARQTGCRTGGGGYLEKHFAAASLCMGRCGADAGRSAGSSLSPRMPADEGGNSASGGTGV